MAAQENLRHILYTWLLGLSEVTAVIQRPKPSSGEMPAS
jgi:hypothetical protein